MNYSRRYAPRTPQVVVCARCKTLADSPDARNGKREWLCVQCADYCDHRRRLKPGVLAVVENLISTTAQPASWSAYESARKALARACAGDADQVDAALVVYARAVGL